MTRDFHFADHLTAGHQDLRNDGGVIRARLIALLERQLDDDPAGAGWFEGEGRALRAAPIWSSDIK